MSTDKIRLALIGCGNMGSYYAHNFSRMEGVEIAVCCDPSASKLETFREKWKIRTGYTDWRVLLTETDKEMIDAVVGCTVDSLRGEIFQSCLASGLPLFTEKPFAVPFDIIKGIPSDRLEKQVFMINFSKRCLPPVSAARNFIAGGGLGRLHRMELHYRQGWVLNHDFGDWHDSSPWFWRLTEDLSRHGILGDLSSHLFDLAVFFAGSVSSISCVLNTITKKPAEMKGHRLNSPDEALCLMKMESGLPALVNATRTAAGEKDSLKIMICGEKGTIKIAPEEMKNSYRLFLTGNGGWDEISCPDRPRKNHEQFIDHLKGRYDPMFPGIKDALDNELLIEAALESHRQDRMISIDEIRKETLGQRW